MVASGNRGFVRTRKKEQKINRITLQFYPRFCVLNSEFAGIDREKDKLKIENDFATHLLQQCTAELL